MRVCGHRPRCEVKALCWQTRRLAILQGLCLRAGAMQLGGFMEEREERARNQEGSPLWSVSLWSLLRGVPPVPGSL